MNSGKKIKSKHLNKGNVFISNLFEYNVLDTMPSSIFFSNQNTRSQHYSEGPFSIFPRTTTWSFDTHLKSLICRKPAMAVLKVFCLCITPRTGSVVLGGLGIIMAVLMIVPPCLILESHEYYFNEFIREQKTYGGRSF